jgi:hypothetical protein
MLASLTARGDLSPTTVRYAYAVLRIALGRALKSGRVARNVATLVDPPAKVRREPKPLTAEEVGRLIDATTDDRLGALYAVAIATGLRQGELLALRWSDVDLALARSSCAIPAAAARASSPSRKRIAPVASCGRGRDGWRVAIAPRPAGSRAARSRPAVARRRLRVQYVSRNAGRQPQRDPSVSGCARASWAPHHRFHDTRRASTRACDRGHGVPQKGRRVGWSWSPVPTPKANPSCAAGSLVRGRLARATGAPE